MNPQTYLHTPAPPVNRWGLRLGLSPGGPPPGRTAWASAHGILDTHTRFPETTNDAGITYERAPWYHQSYAQYDPAGSGGSTGLVDLMSSGAARRSLHMRCVTIRPYVAGQSNTRNQDPNPVAGYGTQDGTNQGRLSGDGRVHGMHSRPASRAATLARTLATPQQRPPRQSRLSDSRNSGQSYSQTTLHQGFYG